MKKLSVIVGLVIGISVVFVSCYVYNSKAIRGDGNIITFEKEISSFETVQIRGGVRVNYHASNEYRAVVSVDSNLAQYVNITQRNNRLTIGTKEGSYSFTEFEVDIYCPFVKEVSVSGSVNFECMDKMVVPTFTFDVSGSGNLNGSFDCNKFSAHISGSGKINGSVECSDFSVRISGSGGVTVSGTAQNSDINISGSGSFHGREFKTNTSNSQVSGSGNIHIWVVDYLNATISGSGGIIYRGNPKINFSSSGSGRIKSE